MSTPINNTDWNSFFVPKTKKKQKGRILFWVVFPLAIASIIIGWNIYNNDLTYKAEQKELYEQQQVETALNNAKIAAEEYQKLVDLANKVIHKASETLTVTVDYEIDTTVLNQKTLELQNAVTNNSDNTTISGLITETTNETNTINLQLNQLIAEEEAKRDDARSLIHSEEAEQIIVDQELYNTARIFLDNFGGKDVLLSVVSVDTPCGEITGAAGCALLDGGPIWINSLAKEHIAEIVAHEYVHTLTSYDELQWLNDHKDIWHGLEPSEGAADCGIKHFVVSEWTSYVGICTPEQNEVSDKIITDTLV
jgi:hypothetical protein